MFTNRTKAVNSMDKKRIEWTIIWASFIVFGAYSFLHGPQFGDDSYGYLRMDLYRPIGYPLILFFLEVFGNYHQFAVIIFQIAINIGAGAFFLKKIKKIFGLDFFSNLIVLVILLFTIVSYSKPNVLLTEAVTFPLFLIVAIYIVESIISHNNRYLYKAIILSTLIFLIREQFLILYPIIGLLYLYNLLYWNKNKFSLRVLATFIAANILLLIAASTLNKTYHYLLHDTFSNPHSNVSIFPTLAYSSDLSDSELFNDPEIQDSFRDIYQLIDEKGYTMKYFYENIYNKLPPEERQRRLLIQHYHENFENIQNTVRNYYGQDDKSIPGRNERHLKMESAVDIMTGELIKSHFSTFMYLNLADIFVYAFNAEKGYLGIFFLICMICLYGLLKGHQYGTILFFFLALHITNLLASSLSIKIIPRYTFYTIFMISVIHVIYFYKFIIKEKVKRPQNKIL